MHEVDSFEHEGVEVKIVYDDHPDNPRGWRDSLTTYVWADKDHIMEKHDERINLDRFDFRESTWTPTALAARWLTLFDGNAIAVPFRIDDYGSGGNRAYLTDVDDDRVTGFVTVSQSVLDEEMALSSGWDVMEYIKAEFGEFAAWVEGEVYCWIIEPTDEDEDGGDSCCGYYGDIEYVRTCAKEAAEIIAKDRFVNQEPPDIAEMMAWQRS